MGVTMTKDEDKAGGEAKTKAPEKGQEKGPDAAATPAKERGKKLSEKVIGLYVKRGGKDNKDYIAVKVKMVRYEGEESEVKEEKVLIQTYSNFIAAGAVEKAILFWK